MYQLWYQVMETLQWLKKNKQTPQRSTECFLYFKSMTTFRARGWMIRHTKKEQKTEGI